MRRKFILYNVLFLLVPIFIFAANGSKGLVGIIHESYGTVSVTRSGEVLREIDLGSNIYNFDLLKTGNDGMLVIDLAPNSGMAGVLTIKPNSVFTVKVEIIKDVSITEGEILVGSIGVRVKKLSGAPSVQIRSGHTIMGVRGTEFEVLLSVNDSILVSCSEGIVACSGEGGQELEALPGYVVEQEAGERLRRIPVAVSSLEDFRSRWYAEEISAFQGAPVQAIEQYAATYLRFMDEFRSASDALSAEPAIAQWKFERKNGIVPPSMDVQVMRQKSAVIPKLMALRRVLFFFERVYYRLDEIAQYIPKDRMQDQMSNGLGAGEFLKFVKADLPELERRSAEYRFVLSLYAERNEGLEPVFLDSDSGTFFGEVDSFFD